MSTPENKLPKMPEWQEIAEVIGQTVEECNAKWINLHVSFKTNLKQLPPEDVQPIYK